MNSLIYRGGHFDLFKMSKIRRFGNHCIIRTFEPGWFKIKTWLNRSCRPDLVGRGRPSWYETEQKDSSTQGRNRPDTGRRWTKIIRDDSSPKVCWKRFVWKNILLFSIKHSYTPYRDFHEYNKAFEGKFKMLSSSLFLKVILNNCSEFRIVGTILCGPISKIQIFIEWIENTFYSLKQIGNVLQCCLSHTCDWVDLFVGKAGRQTDPIPSPLNLGIAENIASDEFISKNKASIKDQGKI